MVLKQKPIKMEKKVTKAEVERVLEQYLTPITKESILNELFPSFKVGDYLTPIETNGALNAKTGDICIVDSIDAEYVYVEWITYVRQNNGGYSRFNFRHATPEEIAAAEWEEGKVYRVWHYDEWRVRVSAKEVGCFYLEGSFEGVTRKHIKYEKL